MIICLTQVVELQVNIYELYINHRSKPTIGVQILNYINIILNEPSSYRKEKSENESEVARSCLTLCDRMDYSLPGFSVHGIFQSEYWLLLLLSHFSRVRLCATPEPAALQAPPSPGFSKHEYWSVLPFPSPGDLPHPGNEPGSPALQADVLPSEPPGKSRKE